MFTQLHLHTQMSLLDGIGTSEQYAQKALEYNHPSLAITDHGRMAGVFQHQKACQKYGIKPIFGVEMYIVDDLVTLNDKNKRIRTKTNHLILLAKNETGYKNLLKLNYLSMKDENHFYYSNRIIEDELFNNSEGIIVGTACMASKWGKLLEKGKVKDAEQLFLKYLDKFKDDFYAEIQLNELTYRMNNLENGQKSINDFFINLANKHGVPIVLTGDVHYSEKGQDILQTISIAIRNKDTIDNLSFELESKNLFYHKEEDYVQFNKDFGYNYKVSDLFKWMGNSQIISKKCNYEIPKRKKMYLPKITENDDERLVKLANDGLYQKFDKSPPREYKVRLKQELEVLLRKGFSSYILLLYEMLDFVKTNGYSSAPGRGSAAGSLVLYTLGITKLDPIKYGLLFSRFLSDHRSFDMVCSYFPDIIERGKINYTFTEFKTKCFKAIKKYPELRKDFIHEFMYAKNFYKNKIDLLSVFESGKKITGKYIIPYILGYTSKVEEKFKTQQVITGASGGIDIDTDISPSGRDPLFNFLRKKFGEDRVLQVGAYSRLGLKSSIKDLLRVYKVDFKKSNEFTRYLDSSLNLEENLNILKEASPHLYKFYKENQKIIDMAKEFSGKIRQISKHAGGIVVLDRPVYELIPVERVNKILLTAFPESGSEQVLDELGVIKFDILGISTLDIIDDAIERIKENIYLIEDNDGLIKAVPESYIEKEKNK